MNIMQTLSENSGFLNSFVLRTYCGHSLYKIFAGVLFSSLAVSGKSMHCSLKGTEVLSIAQIVGSGKLKMSLSAKINRRYKVNTLV